MLALQGAYRMAQVRARDDSEHACISHTGCGLSHRHSGSSRKHGRSVLPDSRLQVRRPEAEARIAVTVTAVLALLALVSSLEVPPFASRGDANALQAPGVGSESSPCGPRSTMDRGLVCAWEAVASAGPVTSSSSPTPQAPPPQCCCRASGALPTRVGESNPLWNDTTADAVRCFPHAIIVGAQKGGTTALFLHFLMRPDFEAPTSKEVGYVSHSVSHWP